MNKYTSVSPNYQPPPEVGCAGLERTLLLITPIGGNSLAVEKPRDKYPPDFLCSIVHVCLVWGVSTLICQSLVGCLLRARFGYHVDGADDLQRRMWVSGRTESLLDASPVSHLSYCFVWHNKTINLSSQRTLKLVKLKLKLKYIVALMYQRHHKANNSCICQKTLLF